MPVETTSYPSNSILALFDLLLIFLSFKLLLREKITTSQYRIVGNQTNSIALDRYGLSIINRKNNLGPISIASK